MKQLLGLILAILPLIALSVCERAEAFTPPNDRLYPPLTYKSPMIEKIKASRLATWQAIDNYGWSGWRGLVAESLNSEAAYAGSMGRTLTAEVPSFRIREAQPGEPVDMQHFAVVASVQQTMCNDPNGWSVACAYLLNPLPAPVYYKAATMLLYPFVSQAAVVIHETCHVVCRACDQYRGGCPPTDNEAVRCTGNPDSVMDCSTSASLSARTMQPFDVETFLLATGFTRGCPAPTSGSYDPCTKRWYFQDPINPPGRMFSIDPETGVWFNPDGQPEYYPCNPLAHRWNPNLKTKPDDPGSWTRGGVDGFYSIARLYWSFSPAC